MADQLCFEVVEVVVAEADLPHPGGGEAVVHGGVIEAVAEHQRLGAEKIAIEQRRQNGGIGLKAGVEDQRRRLALVRPPPGRGSDRRSG